MPTIIPDNAGTATWQEHPANWAANLLELTGGRTIESDTESDNIDFSSVRYAGVVVTPPAVGLNKALGTSGVIGYYGEVDSDPEKYWWQFRFTSSAYKVFNLMGGDIHYGSGGVGVLLPPSAGAHDPSGTPGTSTRHFEVRPFGSSRSGTVNASTTVHPNRGWFWSPPLTAAEFRGNLPNPSDLVPQMRPWICFAERMLGIPETEGWKLRVTCTDADPLLDHVDVWFKFFDAASNPSGEWRPDTLIPGGPTAPGTILDPPPVTSPTMTLPVDELPVGESVEFDMYPGYMESLRDGVWNSLVFAGAVADGSTVAHVTLDDFAFSFGPSVGRIPLRQGQGRGDGLTSSGSRQGFRNHAPELAGPRGRQGWDNTYA